MKGKAYYGIGVLVVAAAGYAYFGRGGEKAPEIEYRYAEVKTGELLRSISATGQVVALTKVDVKSQAGGKVVQLAVDEGSIVKKGDLIALIDPEDTQTLFEQASADLQGANARAGQAEKTLAIQIAQAKNDVDDARAALDIAKARQRRAALEARRQPSLTSSAVASATAALATAEANLYRMRSVTVLQMKRDAEANLKQAEAQRENALANLKRQEELEKKGYVPGANVDQAKATAEAARTGYTIALQRTSTIDNEIQAMLRAQEKTVEQARANLDQANANTAQDDIARTSLVEAERAVVAAEVALRRALDNQMQVEVRRNEVLAAKAATVRNQVSVRNAKTQLDNTTVLAPRDGVVTMKYLEEGTIIPPGTSVFAEGTSIVQLSDVTKLYVECAVDEADIASVKVGQKVRIVTEAYPGQTLMGEVERVNPAAQTEQNITAVKARVRVLPGAKVNVLPGMNATCEFITMEKKDILVVPSQAIKRDGGKTTVKVKGADPKKPEVREVVLGENGNEGVEIISGLKAGDQVVIAEINMAEMLDIQKKMQEVQEGGGLAGGGGRPGAGGGRRR